jgi:hypothetical protein
MYGFTACFVFMFSLQISYYQFHNPDFTVQNL